MTEQTIPDKKKETCDKITNGSRKCSVLDELMTKFSSIPRVKIKNPEEDLKKEDTNAIVENLKKCGLIVKKIPINYNLKPIINSSDNFFNDNMNCDVFDVKKEENCNNNDDLDYINFNDESDHESEYEIETLDDDDSDFEYMPSLKRKVDIENPGVESDKKTKEVEPKKSYKKGEFIKIKSTSYLCIMCNTKFPSLNLLTDHLKNPEPCFVMSVPCTICGKEFPNKSRCTSHMQIHKEKPKFFCDKCGKMFHNTIALSAHLEMMHTEYFDAIGDKFQCKLCDHEASTKLLVLHHVNVTHLHVSTFLCDICGKSFLNESGLKAHIMIHRDTKSFLCQICSKAFKMQSALRAHIKTHSQEKRFVCDECGKSFKKNCTLREHKKCHSGEFTYNCYICDKRFISKSTLNTHIKNHAP